MKENIVDVLKNSIKNCQNPTDLKPSIIGKVVQLSPVIVSISEGKILLEENNELFISEWFRFMCDIDKADCEQRAEGAHGCVEQAEQPADPFNASNQATGRLSSGVPSDLENARGVTETHSYGGASCNMPGAIDYVAQAIEKVTAELLALKCDLTIGDFVVLGSLEQLDKYILLDKVL